MNLRTVWLPTIISLIQNYFLIVRKIGLLKVFPLLNQPGNSLNTF